MNELLNFVLVPKQLGEVAFLPSTPSTMESWQQTAQWHAARVYGDGWHLAIDSDEDDDILHAQEQDILRAQKMYGVADDEDSDDDDSMDEDDDDFGKRRG
jgi:hypothetical protein